MYDQHYSPSSHFLLLLSLEPLQQRALEEIEAGIGALGGEEAQVQGKNCRARESRLCYEILREYDMCSDNLTCWATRIEVSTSLRRPIEEKSRFAFVSIGSREIGEDELRDLDSRILASLRGGWCYPKPLDFSFTIPHNQSEDPSSSVSEWTDWKVRTTTDNDNVIRTDEEYVIESDKDDQRRIDADSRDDEESFVPHSLDHDYDGGLNALACAIRNEDIDGLKIQMSTTTMYRSCGIRGI
uniref:Uncharacterized protein n=1 Tax=Ananas comosus var. bracteatus TaxID=296719 RepID=A0A6V7NSQ0_ANACO|nr:unnamed protein product [Ananas comosus var. bracteatus]